MKLDYDIIRHILLTIESSDSNRLSVKDFCTEEYTPEIISYHILLLMDEEYIEAQPLRAVRSQDFLIHRMTMKGHQYLDSVRDNQIWKETKSTIAKVTSSITLDLIKSVALGLAKKLFSTLEL